MFLFPKEGGGLKGSHSGCKQEFIISHFLLNCVIIFLFMAT